MTPKYGIAFDDYQIRSFTQLTADRRRGRLTLYILFGEVVWFISISLSTQMLEAMTEAQNSGIIQ